MKRLESSVKAPDRNAQFEELYAQYADDVLRMAYFYLADKQKAEDVCQDVFVKLYTRGEAIAPGTRRADAGDHSGTGRHHRAARRESRADAGDS